MNAAASAQAWRYISGMELAVLIALALVVAIVAVDGLVYGKRRRSAVRTTENITVDLTKRR